MFGPLNSWSWIPRNLWFCYILFLEKTHFLILVGSAFYQIWLLRFTEKRRQTMLGSHNARVNSHPRWKQTRFRVCFHLWCELTLTMNVTEWQVSWNSWKSFFGRKILDLDIFAPPGNFPSYATDKQCQAKSFEENFVSFIYNYTCKASC